jgi:hypothetical protein
MCQKDSMDAEESLGGLVIKFLGSDPCGREEWMCDVCKRAFELRQEEGPDECFKPDANEEPIFCPYCGASALADLIDKHADEPLTR